MLDLQFGVHARQGTPPLAPGATPPASRGRPLDSHPAFQRNESDPDLAEAIVDRILERGRFLVMDGPSLRTRHIDHDHLPDPARISGKSRPEFPEPTAYLSIRPACEHDGLWVTKFRTAMSKRAIQAMMAKYLGEAGITGASVHSLRHTMATHHVARGTDLKTVQETLGHADLATTSMYVSLARRAQRKALQDHAL